MGEEGEGAELRTEADSSNKRKLEEIQIAKQKAQEIVARLVNDAEAKRPRFDDPSDNHGPNFSQKPLSQLTSNSQAMSVPFAAPPIPYNNFQAASKKLEIPNAKVGVIIGKGGETIKYLQLQSGARIQVTRDADAVPYSQTRDVELIGTSEQISRAEQLIKDVISESDAGGSGSMAARGLATLQPGADQFTMKVPNNKVAMIIGKGGETIKNMQSRSGARIQVIPLHLPPGDTSTERTVYINGTKEQIESAKALVNEIISENRVRNVHTSTSYGQQGFQPPGNWAPPGQPPVPQAAYGYAQPGVYPNPPPYYGSYPPQPTGWDQAPPSGSQLPQQSAGYNYYGQQAQTGSAPSTVGDGYAQTATTNMYGYDQGYYQQQNYGQGGPSQGQQHDPNNPYATSGYGPPNAMPAKPDGTTSQPYGSTPPPPAQAVGTSTSQPYGSTPPPPAQTVGASTSQAYGSTPLPAQTVGTTTSQPYGTQSVTPPPPQPVAYSQQPTSPAGYAAAQNYSVPPAPQPTYDQSGLAYPGYGGQQSAQLPGPVSYGQGTYPPQQGTAQSSYAQGTNTPAYGQPQPHPTNHAYPQPTGYGEERKGDGNVIPTQEARHPPS